ncbi:MAG: transposase [Spirochaetia bacterium]|nr:transposase [Spirochaetia bacterium]
MSASRGRDFKNKSEWEKYLKILGIRDEYSAKKATEGALLGVIMKKIQPALAIVSDDAGQFDILRHALCWVHSERCITSIHAVSYDQDQIIKDILEKYWELVRKLHEYKRTPIDRIRKEIVVDFDHLFSIKTEMPSLNKALASLFKKKQELLLVLEEPEIPLTNNISERDIRDQAKKRKISAGTRSESGRNARDTFMTLQKTCKKLGISFHDYLLDRLSGAHLIADLTKLMKTKAGTIYKALPDY